MAEFGIHPYHHSPTAKVDLVLVHGLLGDSEGTWSGKSDTGEVTYWPAWVRDMRPHVNVWLADYNSSLSAWLQPAMPLDQIASSLLAHAHDQGLGERPIHWVGHSMGGLVIKHILCRADRDPDWELVAQADTAVTFLGTPHHGASLADWKNHFSEFLRAADLLFSGSFWGSASRVFGWVREAVDGQKRDSHIDQLTKHNVALGSLNRDFALWMRKAHERNRLVAIRNYMEALPVRGVVTVVPNASAMLSNGIAKDLGVDADHFSICKFSRGTGNAVFDGILKALADLSGRVRVGSREDQSTKNHRQDDDRVDRAWRSALERCSVNVLAQMCIEFKGVLGDCRPTLHDLESALVQAFQKEDGPRALRAHIKEALPGKAGGLSIDERCDRDRLYVMLLIQSVALTYRASVQGETMGELVVPDRERQFAVAAAAHIVLGLGVQLTVQPGAVSIDNLIDTAGCADAAACPPGRVPSDNPLEDELKRWVGRLSKGGSSPESTADLKASLALQEQREHARPILLDTIGMLTDPTLRILVRSLDIGAVDTAADGRPANISPGLWSDLCGQLDNQIVWLNKQSTSVPAIAHPPAQVPAQMPLAEAPGPMVQVNITGAVGQSNVSAGSHSPIHAQHVAAAMPADTQAPLSVELFALEMAVCDRPHLQQHLHAMSLVVQQRQLTAHALGVLRSALPELRGAAAGSDDVRAAWRTLCQAVHVHWPESSAFFN
jgi:pimeloyl-ACP methyl ester carboxylesterase